MANFTPSNLSPHSLQAPSILANTGPSTLSWPLQFSQFIATCPLVWGQTSWLPWIWILLCKGISSLSGRNTSPHSPAILSRLSRVRLSCHIYLTSSLKISIPFGRKPLKSFLCHQQYIPILSFFNPLFLIVCSPALSLYSLYTGFHGFGSRYRPMGCYKKSLLKRKALLAINFILFLESYIIYRNTYLF